MPEAHDFPLSQDALDRPRYHNIRLGLHTSALSHEGNAKINSDTFVIAEKYGTVYSYDTDLSCTMITSEKITQAVNVLAKEAQPCKIILFGSYARGEATPDSDLDFLVIEPEVSHKREEMAFCRKYRDMVA